MQAMETERSPGLPSLMVTTRRRLMPQGTSFSFLQAVTQALHSMQRSLSQRNFMRAISVPPCGSGSDSRSAPSGAPRSQPWSCPPDLAERDLGFLHEGHRVVAVGGQRVDALAEHDRVGAGGIVPAAILAHEPAAEMEGHEGDAAADALGHQRLDAGLRSALRPGHP